MYDGIKYAIIFCTCKITKQLKFSFCIYYFSGSAKQTQGGPEKADTRFICAITSANEQRF